MSTSDQVTLNSWDSKFAVSALRSVIDELFIVKHDKKFLSYLPQKVNTHANYTDLPADLAADENSFFAKQRRKYMNELMVYRLLDNIEELQNIISETGGEIRANGRFGKLMGFLKEKEEESEKEKIFIENYSKNRIKHSMLRNKLLNCGQEGEKRIAKLDQEIMELEQQINDEKIQNEIKVILVHKWEAMKQEQFQFVLDIEEKRLKESIKSFEFFIDRENIVFHEFSAFTENKVGELNKTIEEWKVKHQTDVNDLDTRIKELRQKIDDQRKLTEESKEVYREREKEIIDYNIELERRRRIEEEILRQYNAAVKIQSWWRGTMVRKQLGPYKPKKKSKKSKQKDKK